MSDTKKKALVLRDFNDAGTGERFTKNGKPLIEAGAFENYKAAGLVEAVPRAASSTPATRPAAKKRTSAAAKLASAPVADPAVTLPA